MEEYNILKRTRCGIENAVSLKNYIRSGVLWNGNELERKFIQNTEWTHFYDCIFLVTYLFTVPTKMTTLDLSSKCNMMGISKYCFHC